MISTQKMAFTDQKLIVSVPFVSKYYISVTLMKNKSISVWQSLTPTIKIESIRSMKKIILDLTEKYEGNIFWGFNDGFQTGLSYFGHLKCQKVA